MQKVKVRLYPDCSYCGQRLDKKHEILPGLVICPKCKNEHYVKSAYDQKIMSMLSAADIKKNAEEFNEAYGDYKAIADEHPELIEPHWGMFLCTFGILYLEEDNQIRYMPVLHRYNEEIPTHNKHYLQVLELAKDKHKNKYFVTEGELINKIWRDSKAEAKKAEKNKSKKVEIIEKFTSEISEESPFLHMVGSKIPTRHNDDPILENKIKNAEIIFLKTNKFSRANKIFEEVLEIDPCSKRALWGKLLCKLQISSFELLGFNIKLNPIFPLFEEVIKCSSIKEYNFYLSILETYFFKKLKSIHIFDDELYNYIMNWKIKKDQQNFANQLYSDIRILLQQEKIADISGLQLALAQATKFDKIEKKELYISKYINIAQDLNLLGMYKHALNLAETILLEDGTNQDALLIRLCATYKVPKLSDLHLAKIDLKQIQVFEDLFQSGYKRKDLFEELRLAADDLIEQNNELQAIPLIDLFMTYLPKKEDEFLKLALTDFSSHFIYKEKYTEAEKYVNLLLEIDPMLATAHWNKLMISLTANTNFDVLMNAKKDLMDYPDFALTITSSNPKDYIKFHEFHDQLRQPVSESRKFKSQAKKHYVELKKNCCNCDIHTFVETIIPEMKKEIEVLAKDEHARITNLFMRSILIVIIIGFAFMVSNIRMFFDPAETNDGIEISRHLWEFFLNLGGYIVMGVFILAFIFKSIIEGKGFVKGLIRGFLLGFVFGAAALAASAAIPWVWAHYLGEFLFGISTYIVSGTLFGLVAIGSFFILRGFHIHLKAQTDNKKSLKASWINIIVLAVIILAALAFSISSLIL